jgi:hypothetical protein
MRFETITTIILIVSIQRPSLSEPGLTRLLTEMGGRLEVLDQGVWERVQRNSGVPAVGSASRV